MRILLAHNGPYYPALGGGDKSNRLLMEALAARGHEVSVFARLDQFSTEQERRFIDRLHAHNVLIDSIFDGEVRFHRHGVAITTLAGHAHVRNSFASEVSRFDPDAILTSTDDPGQLLLEISLRVPRARVVYLVRATVACPFGPESAMPSSARTALLKQVDGMVGVSQYVADYARRWVRPDAVHVPISLLEPGHYPDLGRFDNEFVTLVNPCAVKGISVFLQLAQRMREVQFAAVPTWGTNERDLAALHAEPNVHVLAPVDNIDELFRRTRVTLVPSLWAEARSRMILESMARGIPVMASDVGGLSEAMLGVDYLLPVRPIQNYRGTVDGLMVPVGEVPPQDVGPWYEALSQLVTDPKRYADLSRQSRSAALRYAEQLSAEPFERYLLGLLAQPKRSEPIKTPAALSPEKQRLLRRRLHQRVRGPE